MTGMFTAYGIIDHQIGGDELPLLPLTQEIHQDATIIRPLSEGGPFMVCTCSFFSLSTSFSPRKVST